MNNILNKYEHETLKLVEVILRGRGKKENNERDETNRGIFYPHMEMSQQLLFTNKNILKRNKFLTIRVKYE
jgi:hypothetical protein